MHWWQFLLLACVAIQTIPLSVIDLREHRLPNLWVLPGYAVVLVCWIGEWMATGAAPIVGMASSAGYFFFLFLLSFLGGMGFGDVKLAGILGAAAGSLSLTTAVLSPFFAFGLGALASIVSVLRLATSAAGPSTSAISVLKQHRIAFGPFMLGGFWCAVLVNLLLTSQ